MGIQPLIAQDLDGSVKTVIASFAQDSSGDPLITVAAATEDNVKVTGKTVDRLGYESAICVITAAAVLTADKLASFAVEYQDSADDSTWNTAVALQASTTLLTGTTGTGSTEHDEIQLGLNCAALERYIRFNITLDLNAGATDTCEWTAACILGGARHLIAE